MINKKKFIDEIISSLNNDLQLAINAANDAHAAAVDDESVAETQYDTLAIEAGYLAQGQSKRVLEFQKAITAYQSLEITYFSEDSVITMGALVQLDADSKTNHWFFIGPAAGGFRYEIMKQKITVITPQSPMGIALLGKQQDDDVEIMLGANKLSDFIAAVQ